MKRASLFVIEISQPAFLHCSSPLYQSLYSLLSNPPAGSTSWSQSTLLWSALCHLQHVLLREKKHCIQTIFGLNWLFLCKAIPQKHQHKHHCWETITFCLTKVFIAALCLGFPDAKFEMLKFLLCVPASGILGQKQNFVVVWNDTVWSVLRKQRNATKIWNYKQLNTWFGYLKPYRKLDIEI